VCIEEGEDRDSADKFTKLAKKCAQKNNLDPEEIVTCANGPEGDKLIDALAKKTPEHSSVPAFFVDGKADEKAENDIEDNFYKWACDNFKGVKPSGCSHVGPDAPTKLEVTLA